MYNTGHMNATKPTKPKRKITNFELSPPARGALKRISKAKGWTMTRAVEMALFTFESNMATTSAAN